jgi:hypothetical protein
LLFVWFLHLPAKYRNAGISPVPQISYLSITFIMKKVLLTFLLLTAFPLMASHIVGGEFELLHISGNTYRLNMVLYFDKINGNPGAKDQPGVTVTIFRKRDNVIMDNVFLSLISETNVSYTQPSCSRGEIQTSKIIYSSTVVLASNVYNDPHGYYISWQRCCRNYSIDNVFSVSGSTTQYAGQTFYMEFPPVTKNGQPFINSSPKLFPPLNDYACPFRPYYVDFAGVDDDKDSLVYSLVTPLNTKSATALPPAAPLPYPEVLWRPPYSSTNVIDGVQDLRITKDGLLTCTPRAQGLFVFAVKVDEFRKGVKIGESRRDFQMLVVDACPVASPPQITGKKLEETDFSHNNTMSVSFDNTVSDANRCIQVRVSDLDSSQPDQNFAENVGIRVVGLNFKSPDINRVLPSVTRAVLTNGSTVDFRVCFPQCPYINGPYQIGIIAFDDACSLPLTDTLRVTVNVQPPPNERPYFTTPKLTSVEVTEGDQPLPWIFQAKDKDLDNLTVAIVTDGFALNDYGMAVNFVQQAGLVNGQLTWNPRCSVYDFYKRTAFTIKVLVDDIDQCNWSNPDTAVYKLSIKLPSNASPIIDTDLTSFPLERKVKIERRILETFNFKVTGSDLVDGDFLTLSMKGIGFNAADYPVTFSTATGNGLVSSNFSWNIGCDKIDLKKKDTYTFQFIVVDKINRCLIYSADTVDVEVKLLLPDNAKPRLTATDPSRRVVTNSDLEYIIGQPIEINFLGTDADHFPAKDNLTLSLLSATGNVAPSGYSFQQVIGKSPIQSIFSWNPDCSIFKDQVYENNYTFQFRLADDRCLNAKADTIRVNIRERDIEGGDEKFYLPNVFTPNGDSYNDYFALEDIEGELNGVSFDQKVSLPKDNCNQRFESIQIFNRWGGLVFESTDRKFRWYAPHESAGVYFYRIKYSNREYKSPLSVRY